MSDDLERWERIEAVVDDLLEEAANSGDADAADALLRDVARALGDDDQTTPIDQPVDQRFDLLLDRAMTSRGAFGASPGDTIGSYRLESLLGEGGMGTVFLASRADGSFEQQVALKVLHRSPTDDDARTRFLQERQILAGLRHPHIATLFDGGMVGDTPYLVMERIEGLPLIEYCNRHQLNQEQRIRLFLQACDAVHYAHRAGVVHRDLKPSNLLVEQGTEETGRLVVLDFGIALVEQTDRDVTSTGQIFGTPGYMSPEQALGKRAQIDRRTDVYSLGVLLYELLSGKKPYEVDDTSEVLRRVLDGEITPLRERMPQAPIDLQAITETCLALEPSRRYASVHALGEDLERFLEGRPIAARRESFAERWLRRARQRPKTAALVAGAALTALISVVTLAIMAVRHARDLELERNAAIVAQREAEDLLDFMLQDLHEGLDKVGRLDLLQQVAQRALRYYEHRGEADFSRLSNAEFPARAQAAESGAADVIRRARSLANAAQVFEDQGDWGLAQDAYESNLATFRRLMAEQPTTEWQLQLARVLSTLAEVVGAAGDMSESLDYAEEAVSLARASSGRDGEQWSDQQPIVLFDSLLVLGGLAGEMGQPERAFEVIDEALELAARMIERQSSEPQRAWRHRRAVALSYHGLVSQQEGDFADALEKFERASALCEELVAADPSNTQYREELQLALARAGYAYLDVGDLTGAAKTLRSSREEAERLLAVEPGRTDWLRELSVVHAALSAVHRESGALREALAEQRESLEISRQLTRRFPDNPSHGNDLSWDLLDLGRIHRELGEEELANTHWAEAVEVGRRVNERHPGVPYYTDTLVQGLLELGRLAEARPLAEDLIAAGWRTPDFLALVTERLPGLVSRDALETTP